MEAWEKSVKDKTSKKITKKQWLTICAIGSVHFSAALCMSIQAPFYPQEAELKGATATEYGLVFGCYEFIAFIISPLAGRYLHVLGVKTTLNLGMMLGAISAICFGLLDLVQTHTAFITLSFITRMAEAVGTTTSTVAAFSITAAVFPDSVATIFATLETFFGLGFIVGPSLGGLLFSFGGYKLPFIVMGTGMLIGNICVFLVLPPLNKPPDTGHVKIWEILKVAGVQLNVLAIIAISISMGFLAATLEPHIRIFQLSPALNGLMFIISGGTYALIAPIVGRICDKWIYPKRVLSIGSLLIIASYILIGPAPFLGIQKTLILCIIGLVIHGFGLAALTVPTFIDSLSSAVAAGFPNDLSTYGVISGLWMSSFSLGAFVGPSISGYLYDLVGFQYGIFFVIGVHTLLFIGITIYMVFEKKTIKKPQLDHVPDISLLTEKECLNPEMSVI